MPLCGKNLLRFNLFFSSPRKKFVPSGPSVFSPWPRRHKPITTKISSVAVEPVCAVAACAPAFKVVTLSHGVRESCFHHNHHPIACRADWATVCVEGHPLCVAICSCPVVERSECCLVWLDKVWVFHNGLTYKHKPIRLSNAFFSNPETMIDRCLCV